MTDERVRLFVALELPGAIRDALIAWRISALPDLPGLRPVSRESLHVTLCFLGWRLESEIEPIAAACDRSSSMSAPALSLAAAIWLPPRRPRVLAVRLEDTGGACATLQAALADALVSGGWYEPEPRPFLAHVTTARVGRRERVKAVELPAPPRVDFTAATVTLYRSLPTRGGSQYQALRQIGLSVARSGCSRLPRACS